MQNTKRTTYISSNIGRGCEHCDATIGSFAGSSDVAGSINHYIEAHGYKLLHVGTETEVSSGGKFSSHTVAVLGHDDPPALRALPKVIISVGAMLGDVAGVD